MSNTSILWQPIVPAGENLHCAEPDLFILQMAAAFPERRMPILLTAKDLPILCGMAAATAIVGNPYRKLTELLTKFPKVQVEAAYGEDHGL
jgi:hypothetical protein